MFPARIRLQNLCARCVFSASLTTRGLPTKKVIGAILTVVDDDEDDSLPDADDDDDDDDAGVRPHTVHLPKTSLTSEYPHPGA